MTAVQALGYLLVAALLLAASWFAVKLHRNLPPTDPASCPHATVDDLGVCVDCRAFVEGPAERVAVPVVVEVSA